jgi:transposase
METKRAVEMAQLWQGDISSRTISRASRENWVYAKKKTDSYLERDESKGQTFIEQKALWADETIVYVDEAGIDNRADYGFGWNLRGQRFHALKSGRQQGRVNMIAALCQEQVMAPFTVEGSCHRVLFQIWLEACLIPLLKPGQVVVMDNATFRKGGRIEQLIQEAGCELLYLPAYSPDFNKIEGCWSWPGSRIRNKQLEQFECLGDAMEYVLHLAS